LSAMRRSYSHGVNPATMTIIPRQYRADDDLGNDGDKKKPVIHLHLFINHESRAIMRRLVPENRFPQGDDLLAMSSVRERRDDDGIHACEAAPGRCRRLTRPHTPKNRA